MFPVRLLRMLNDFVDRYLRETIAQDIGVRNVSLPWERMFEVAFALETGNG